MTDLGNKSLSALASRIINEDTGYDNFTDEKGIRHQAYFKTIKETGWKLVLNIPDSELFAPLRRLMLIISGISVLILFITSIFGKFLAEKLSGPIIHLNEKVMKLANGDLTVNETEEKNDAESIKQTDDDNELDTLVKNFRWLTSKLREVILITTDISHDLSSSSQEMSATATSFADNAQSQAASTEQLTATVEEISGGTDGISDNVEIQFKSLTNLIEQIRELSDVISGMEEIIKGSLHHIRKISEDAKSGEESMKSMNESMGKISGSSQDMINIVEIITSISEQINLLSLNAAIEAARAGEAGKGFAVVADEISKLADQTSSSINEINNLIKANEEEITKGMSRVMDSINNMSTIIEGVNTITLTMDQIDELMEKQVKTNTSVNTEVDNLKIKSDMIRSATGEQKIAVEEIVKSIANISEVTQGIASGAEQMAGNAENVAGMADSLKEHIQFFKL